MKVNSKLFQLFESQARLTPDAVAICDTKGRSKTYSEFLTQVKEYQAYLITQGVVSNTLAALVFESSIEFVVSL